MDISSEMCDMTTIPELDHFEYTHAGTRILIRYFHRPGSWQSGWSYAYWQGDEVKYCAWAHRVYYWNKEEAQEKAERMIEMLEGQPCFDKDVDVWEGIEKNVEP